MSVTDQRLGALERANEIRSFRARLKRDVKEGRVSVVDVLRDPPDEVLSMRLADVLLMIPRAGTWKAQKIMAEAGISQGVTVGDLSGERRLDVLGVLLRRPVKKRYPKPLKPRAPRPAPPRKPVPPSLCRVCRAKLRVPTGLCGFCADEGREAA